MIKMWQLLHTWDCSSVSRGNPHWQTGRRAFCSRNCLAVTPGVDYSRYKQFFEQKMDQHLHEVAVVITVIIIIKFLMPESSKNFLGALNLSLKLLIGSMK
jgi:hypothetical protein